MPDLGERKLATVRRVSKIEPIEGADRIVKATIDGWELVTQKGNYEPGDLCVYFEIDSFLPVREEFEFLRKGCFKSTVNLGDGFRIKTIKLRGQVSQGLSLPLKDFFLDENDRYYYLQDSQTIWIEEGLDLTEYFGVQKWELPVSRPGSTLGPMNAKGSFPSFLQKTDQERVQNCLGAIKKWIYFGKPEVFEVTDERLRYGLETGVVQNTEDTHYFKSGDQWFKRFFLRNDEETIASRQVFEGTLKMDGSSMTVFHNDGNVGVCSRNYELKRDMESVFWRTAVETGILGAMVQDGRNVAIQGELMGPGVQGNREELARHFFFVFDVYLIDEKRYMTPTERVFYWTEMKAHDVDIFGEKPIRVVPNRGHFAITEETTVADLLEIAKTRSLHHDVAEGIVFKSHSVEGPTFKCINTAYLLEEE